tara:strand:- start:8212 stop:9273 length:1062 start_codon:yes stop_codon:yes gene_type:complete
MQIGLIQLVELLAAYHAGALGLALLTQRDMRGLALLCFVFSAHMLANLIASLNLLPPGWDITSAFGLLYGPAFYLFVRSLCYGDRRMTPLDLLHAIPALIIVIIRPQDPVAQIFGFPLLVAYLVFAYRALLDHRRINRQWRSDDESVNLRWVERGFLAFCAIALFDIARTAAPAVLPLPGDAPFALVLISVTALLTAMSWRGFRHAAQDGPISEQAARSASPDAPGVNPSDHALALADFARIDGTIRTEELWLEPRLSLADVAQRAGGSTRDVSRAINIATGQSFSAYINAMRLAEVERLIAGGGPENRTVLDLAFAAGFNSKSAFNRIYRAETGRTPSQALAASNSPPRPES